jgi:hypothetical protein
MEKAGLLNLDPDAHPRAPAMSCLELHLCFISIKNDKYDAITPVRIVLQVLSFDNTCSTSSNRDNTQEVQHHKQ